MTVPPTPMTTKMQRCPKTPVNGVPRHHTGGAKGMRTQPTPKALAALASALVRTLAEAQTELAKVRNRR